MIPNNNIIGILNNKGKRMKKNIVFLISLVLSTSAFALNDGFNFTECSGSDSFEQQIQHYNGDYENAISVGVIPAGIEGLTINLTSDKDVDIRLYGQDGDKIVHWPHGLLRHSTEESTYYKETKVVYSGYNGVSGKYGHEFITVTGTTQVPMEMKAFGYKAGFATVNYSWTGKEGCSNDGNFTQSIAQDALTLVGDIPAGIPNVIVQLTSDKDLDIQLYGEDGTVLVGWKPLGLLSGSEKGFIEYKDMHIEWSGYNGTNGNKGHEYIKITGNTTEVLTMKVYGYEAGFADVSYSWNNTDMPCTEEYNPVCGGMNQCDDFGFCFPVLGEQTTFSNICKLEEANATLLYDGECYDTTQPCTEEYNPVCGTDSSLECLGYCGEKTYGNLCTLAKANAKFLYNGVCSDTASTPTPPL